MREPPLPRLDPDGMEIVVPWGDIRVGESVFFPCINHARARGQLVAVSLAHKISLQNRVAIERGILGLRVWRTA